MSLKFASIAVRIAFAILSIALPARSAFALPSATQIIQKEGQFAFTDGSSFYLFHKDGSFSSGPVGMSGRTISGHWRGQGDVFTIDGQWGWVNGTSAPSDFREMTLRASPVSLDPKSKDTSGSDPGKITDLGVMGVPKRLYRCYFVVEKLVSITLPKNTSPKKGNPL